MRVGLIARADSGGLGNQTWEIFNHIHPDAVLMVLAEEKAVGVEQPERYSYFTTIEKMEMGIHSGPKPLAEFASNVDVVLTVETSYVTGGFDVIRSAGASGLLLANPELLDPARDGFADRTYLPTPWMNKRNFPILKQPVAMNRFISRRRERDSITTFYHPSAPAMADRNGTLAVLDALEHVRSDCRVYVRGEPRRVKVPDNVELLWLPDYTDDYWMAYPDDADCLLMPRRYGGLCLPLLECAAMGMPALMSNLPPQYTHPHIELVTPSKARQMQMKGGMFKVHDFDPRAVAAAMDKLVSNPRHANHLSVNALKWSRENSWDELLPLWREQLQP